MAINWSFPTSGQPKLWTKGRFRHQSRAVGSHLTSRIHAAAGIEAREYSQKPAESLIARDRSRRHDRVGARNRSTQIEPTMGPSLVVVLKPFSQDALKVPTIEDQKPIETLAPGGANLALHV
jgi:hypothetical protein